MRNTPQTRAVLSALRRLGHATNQELLQDVKSLFPDLTITSVHRITNRLIAEGEAALGPLRQGVAVIDANVSPHDHFICTGCSGMREIVISDEIIAELQRQLGENIVQRGLVISGLCIACQRSEPPGSSPVT